MKKLFQVGGIAAILFLFAACREDHSKHQNHQDSGTQQQAAAAYQCPMKCEGDKTYAQTGTCPVCKMDLKKVE